MNNQRKGMIAVNDAQLYYEDQGQGFPLVFVHAGIADHRMWDDQVPAFAGRYRTIRYDMRGFGQSQPPAGPFAHRDDLYTLLQSLDVARAVLVGCSMGGRTITDFALEHPDMVAALVPVSPALSGYEFEGDPPPLLEAIIAADQAGELDTLNELEVRMWIDGRTRTPDQVDPRLRQKVLEMNRIALNTPYEAAQEQPLDPPAAGRLNEIQAPTLVIYGDLDEENTASAARRLVAGIPDARLVVLPGATHLPNMELPTQFNGILLDFLQSLPLNP